MTADESLSIAGLNTSNVGYIAEAFHSIAKGKGFLVILSINNKTSFFNFCRPVCTSWLFRSIRPFLTRAECSRVLGLPKGSDLCSPQYQVCTFPTRIGFYPSSLKPSPGMVLDLLTLPAYSVRVRGLEG
jgi:hypothetical protein